MSSLPATYVEGFHDLEAVKKMKYKELGKTGLMISALSFGGGPVGCHYGSYNEEEAIAAIRRAIRQGVNYIDTAYWYGQGKSETTIGKALRGIPREAYYIATKVGRYELDYDNMFDFSKEKARKSLERSLQLLHLDYVDVIQVHDIEFAPSLNKVVDETLPELEKLVKEGKAKFIGVTGYPLSALKDCIEMSKVKIDCILSYARLTLFDDSLLQFIPFFKENKVGIINAAAACMRLLTNCPPPEWHSANDETKKLCLQAAEYCKKQGVELGKLAAWHSMQFDEVDTNLIGMQTLKQLEDNLATLNDGLSEHESNVLIEIQDRYISKIKEKHWEGVDVEKYWNAVGKQ